MIGKLVYASGSLTKKLALGLTLALGWSTTAVHSEPIVISEDDGPLLFSVFYHNALFGPNRSSPLRDVIRLSTQAYPSPSSDSRSITLAGATSDSPFIFEQTSGSGETMSVTANDVTLDFIGPPSGNGGDWGRYAIEFDRGSQPSNVLLLTGTVTLNGSDTRQVSINTPTLMPDVRPVLVTDLQIEGNAENVRMPLIRWSIPPESVANEQQLFIWRIEGEGTSARFQLLHISDVPADMSEVRVPEILSQQAVVGETEMLEFGETYILGIDSRYIDATATVDSPLDPLRGRAFKFAEFQLRETTPEELALFIPTVTFDPLTMGPVYTFDIAVQAGETVLIDPDVAVGYDYHVGTSDPAFESVTLPDIGDGLYELAIFDAAGSEVTLDIMVVAGERIDFTTPNFQRLAAEAVPGLDTRNGLAAFGVRGIETSARLDPANATGFVTGLSFVATGRFTGTQTPILEFVADSVEEEVSRYIAENLAHMQMEVDVAFRGTANGKLNQLRCDFYGDLNPNNNIDAMTCLSFTKGKMTIVRPIESLLEVDGNTRKRTNVFATLTARNAARAIRRLQGLIARNDVEKIHRPLVLRRGPEALLIQHPVSADFGLFAKVVGVDAEGKRLRFSRYPLDRTEVEEGVRFDLESLGPGEYWVSRLLLSSDDPRIRTRRNNLASVETTLRLSQAE